MTINGWSESQDAAAIRWEKTQAVWYAAEQLNASEITDIEAIELEAALRNAALLDAETVTDLTRAAYMEAQIVDGVSSPEWWNLIEEDPF